MIGFLDIGLTGDLHQARIARRHEQGTKAGRFPQTIGKRMLTSSGSDKKNIEAI